MPFVDRSSTVHWSSDSDKHCTIPKAAHIEQLMAKATSSLLFVQVLFTREAVGNMSSPTTLTLQILKENKPPSLPQKLELSFVSELPELRCFESDTWQHYILEACSKFASFPYFKRRKSKVLCEF